METIETEEFSFYMDLILAELHEATVKELKIFLAFLRG